MKYIDPYAGGKGNSIRYLSVAPRTDDMKSRDLYTTDAAEILSRVDKLNLSDVLNVKLV